MGKIANEWKSYGNRPSPQAEYGIANFGCCGLTERLGTY
jgi:hypothetical protein